MRLVIIAIAVTMLMLSTLGSCQVVPLWDYNVYLDFGDRNVTIEPVKSSSSSDDILHSVTIRGDNETDYAIIYIYEYATSQMFDLQDRLWNFMKPRCTMVDVDPATISGMSGFIASGKARVAHGFSKQVCYGGIVSLPSGAIAQKNFVVFGHFNNATLNKHLIKTAKIEYAGKMVKI